jgi:hypothetical protein
MVEAFHNTGKRCDQIKKLIGASEGQYLFHRDVMIIKLAGWKGWLGITRQEKLEWRSIMKGRVETPQEHPQQRQAGLRAEPDERPGRSSSALDNTEAADVAHNRSENAEKEENKEEPGKRHIAVSDCGLFSNRRLQSAG